MNTTVLILQAVLATMELVGRLGAVKRMDEEDLKEYVEARELIRKELVAQIGDLKPPAEEGDDDDVAVPDSIPESGDGEVDESGSEPGL